MPKATLLTQTELTDNCARPFARASARVRQSRKWLRAILALDATANALPSSEATRRVPAAIAPAALARNPDFATMTAQDRECVTARGYVGPIELTALITRLERPSTAEIVSEIDGVRMMKIYDKPPPASAENLATAARLRKLHKVALKHNNALLAPQRARERRLNAINDRATKIEIRLSRASRQERGRSCRQGGALPERPRTF
jgi:hypothetical protein